MVTLFGATTLVFGATCTYSGGSWDCGTPTTTDVLIVTDGNPVLSGTWDTAKNITVNGGTLTFSGTLDLKSGSVLTTADGTTLTVNGDTHFRLGSSVTIEGVLQVDGNFSNANNSNSVTINGSMQVDGNFDNGNGGVIDGSGAITANGTINNDGTIGGSTADNLGTLPVELLTVSASIQESGVMVSWETAIELNNEYFRLERSYDGLQFEEISRIEGAGNSSEPLTYQVLDIPPAYGLVIYRLSQTDFDGTTEIFPLFNILYQDLKETKVLAYPTRIPADLKEVKINNIWGTVISHDLRVVEMNGQVSAALHLDFDAEDVKILLPPSGKAGLHFLRGTINGVAISEKLIFLN